MKRKNICLVIDNLVGGGAERSIITLASALSKLGHRVDVIIFEDRIDYVLDNIDFNIHIVKKTKHPIRFIQSRQMVKDLRRKIKALNVQFDLCLANKTFSDKFCQRAKLPNLYHCIRGAVSKMNEEGYTNDSGVRRLRRKIKHSFWVRRLYKNTRLITVSKGVENDLLDFGIKPKSVQTIYNPFDFENIREQAEEYRINEDDYIIHIGRFHIQKRHDVLIHAYQKSGIKEKLLLLGDDKNLVGKKIHQLVRDLNLENKVIFKGFHPNPYPYIKNAKALILSSYFEGLGRVLVEALILKIPVVSTDCPGSSEVLTDELGQFLSPVGNIEALAKNIKKVIEYSPKIKKQHFEKFSAEVCAKKYLTLCQ